MPGECPRGYLVEAPHFGMSPGLMPDSNFLIVAASGVQFSAWHAMVIEDISRRMNACFMGHLFWDESRSHFESL